VETGTYPSSLTFDGTKVWVSNSGTNTVTAIRASDGKIQGTFEVAGNPDGLAFDGMKIWAGCALSTLVAVRARDGVLVRESDIHHQPAGLFFDGTSLWIANVDDASVTKITRTPQ
jgi:sugar lactone lactonase YvrE